MSKKRAFIRYTKKGKLIPGSLILTNGTYPKDGTYLEVNADLCCDFDPRITVKVLGLFFSNKPYDGNNSASFGYSIYPPPVEGILPQDIGKVTVEENSFAEGSKFVTSEVGNHIGVYLNDTFILTGPSAYKYKIDPLAIAGYADITPQYVGITGLTPNNKPYDGNTTATWTGTPAMYNIVPGDDVTLVIGTLAANFTSPSIGINKTVYITGFSITGAQAYRYQMYPNYPIGYANITP